MMLPRLPFLLLLATPALSAFKNDFSDYPSGAQTCLDEADKQSGCKGDNVKEMNACLCSDTGDFLRYTAACVGEESYADLGATYDLLGVNCDGTSTPMEYTEKEWDAIADEAADNADPVDPSNLPDPDTPTAAPDPGPGGLSTGATAGIAVGATAAGAALIGLGVFLFLRRRRNARAAEESNPMLSVGAGPRAGTTPDTAYVSPYQDNKSPAWGPESVSGTPKQQYEGPVQAGGNEVYELAETQRDPVEMPGSQPEYKA